LLTAYPSMKNTIVPLLLALSALLLAVAFFYYLVIYTPQKTHQAQQFQTNEYAKKYCVEKTDEAIAEFNEAVSDVLSFCSYTGICTREQAIIDASDGKPYHDPADPNTRQATIKNCIQSYLR